MHFGLCLGFLACTLFTRKKEDININRWPFVLVETQINIVLRHSKRPTPVEQSRQSRAIDKVFRTKKIGHTVSEERVGAS